MLDKYHFGKSPQAVALSEHLNLWCEKFPKYDFLKKSIHNISENFFEKVNAIMRAYDHAEYTARSFKTDNTLFSLEIRNKIIHSLLTDVYKRSENISVHMLEKISKDGHNSEAYDLAGTIFQEINKVCKLRVDAITKGA